MASLHSSLPSLASSDNTWSTVQPITISRSPRTRSTPKLTLSAPLQPTSIVTARPRTLNAIDEFEWPSDTHLAQSPDPGSQSAFDFSFEDPGHGQGKWASFDVNALRTPLVEVGSYSPNTVTSDGGLTSASTAFSEPMTRDNTNDQISESVAMFRIDSDRTTESSTRPSALELRSPFSFVESIPSMDPVSLSESMKPSLSQESGSSSRSSSPLFKSVSSSSGPSKPRALAPKRHDDASQAPPAVKIVAVKGEDGTIRQKAEIARATRHPQQRKTTFCQFCNDKPEGFHGEHELRRHIERQHTQWRKVWICKEYSPTGTFLQNCKACRNKKTYGANYNAAAHLRRTHFNPPKNKRGGRGKKSEGRGGMGGGNHPAMDELKNWMYEAYEINMNGRVIVQAIAGDGNFPSSDLDQAVDLSQTSIADHNVGNFDQSPVAFGQADNTAYSSSYSSEDQYDLSVTLPTFHDPQQLLHQSHTPARPRSPYDMSGPVRRPIHTPAQMQAQTQVQTQPQKRTPMRMPTQTPIAQATTLHHLQSHDQKRQHDSMGSAWYQTQAPQQQQPQNSHHNISFPSSDLLFYPSSDQYDF